MIPVYPDFAPLQLGHKRIIRELTGRYPPYSDFNFTSLFAWNVDNSTEISQLNSNLAIRFPHYLSRQPTLSILGENNIEATFDTLLSDTDRLEMVPEVVVEKLLQPGKYNIMEDRDNHDYIYNVKNLEIMAGFEYKKKRNKVNHILSEFGQRLSVVTCEEFDNTDEIEIAFKDWAAHTHKNEADTEVEFVALQRSLRHMRELGISISVVRIDGMLAGFSINEQLDGGYAICHFEKNVSTDKDMASYISYVATCELSRRGCTRVNWEQDLGAEGLRQSKVTWRPTEFLKKYVIKKL